MSFDGTLETRGDVSIEGRARGRVESQGRVRIAEGADVEADLEGREVEILGRVVGGVSAADRIDLHERAEVVGDVAAPRIRIADGAALHGGVDMRRER